MVAAALVLLSFVAAEPARPRLIITGWDQPETATFRKHVRDFDALPFDGTAVVVTAQGQPAGLPRRLFGSAHGREKWQESWFRQSLADLRAVDAQSNRKLRHNFLMLNANPGDVDWFDDAGWTQIVDHWRLAARLAAKGGLVGIIFDAEPYVEPHSQFMISRQPQAPKHTRAQYRAKARQRGQEVMSVVVREYPDITLLCYHFLNSINRIRDADGAIRPTVGHEFDLLPEFVNGWFDRISPEARIIDGNEFAYLYNSRLSYLESANRIRRENAQLLDPAHAGAYRSQVLVGQAFYLDAYVNPPDSAYTIDRLGGTSLDRLRENLSSALEVADSTIWVYGEQARWWPEPGSSKPTWQERFPGCLKAIREACQPAEFAKATIDQLSANNLIHNGGFDKGYESWLTWQSHRSKGEFEFDSQSGHARPGSVRLNSVVEGCYLQVSDVKPGQQYAFSVWTKAGGEAQASIMVRWKTADDRWLSSGKDLIRAPAGVSGWRRIVGIARVPEEARKLVVLLQMNSTGRPEDTVWFDDVAVALVL